LLSESSGFTAFLAARDDGFDAAIPSSHPCLADHVVRGHRVLPGVVHLDLALGAAHLKYPGFRAIGFEDCTWTKPLLAPGDGVRAHVALEPAASGRVRFAVRDLEATFASGWIASQPAIPGPWEGGAEIRRRATQGSWRRIAREDVYRAFSELGIDYGPFFRRIERVDIEANHAFARLVGDGGVDIELSNLLDCASQSSIAISIGMDVGSLMPFSLGAMIAHEPLDFGGEPSFCVASEKSTPYRTMIGIYGADGRPLLSVWDLGVRPSRL
jgi:hypothetical protein